MMFDVYITGVGVFLFIGAAIALSVFSTNVYNLAKRLITDSDFKQTEGRQRNFVDTERALVADLDLLVKASETAGYGDKLSIHQYFTRGWFLINQYPTWGYVILMFVLNSMFAVICSAAWPLLILIGPVIVWYSHMKDAKWVSEAAFSNLAQ